MSVDVDVALKCLEPKVTDNVNHEMMSSVRFYL